MSVRRTAGSAAVAALMLATLLTGPVVDAATRRAGPFHYVTKSEELPEDGAVHQISVPCPDGTQFTGAGASLPTGLSATLNYIGRSKGEAAVAVVTAEPNPQNKKVKVTAVCAKEMNVTLDFDFYSVPPMSLSNTHAASCGGNTLVGGGGGDSDGETVPHENYPSSSSEWTITTNNATNATQSGLIVVTCIPAGSRPVELVEATANLSAGDKVQAKCPKGTRVSAGGFELGPDIRASAPYDGKDADKAPDDGWRIIAQDGTGGGSATVHAVCVGKPSD